MSRPIHAVYRAGQIHPLEQVNLSEGQEIRVMILSDEELVRTALGDLLLPPAASVDEDLDEQMLAQVIEEGFREQPPLSETIIQERRTGP